MPKVDLIRQALSAAESSIKLARQLLGELEKEGGRERPPKAKELPGVIGIFDGQNMIAEGGESYPVPENYASKSILVVGDTLKLVDSGGEKRFKQIEHVKRHKTTGMLAKKDGKWTVVTPEGSYRVLPAAVSHFEGEVGDEVLLQLPAANLQTTWAAVENITKKGAKEKTKEVKETKEKTAVEAKKEEEPQVEPKAKEKGATARAPKEKEVQKEAKKVEVAKKEEPKEKPVATPEIKQAPAEPKPTAETVKSVAAEPAPTPAPVPAETKPAPAGAAEDELA
jgi:hypothetical protein